MGERRPAAGKAVRAFVAVGVALGESAETMLGAVADDAARAEAMSALSLGSDNRHDRARGLASALAEVAMALDATELA